MKWECSECGAVSFRARAPIACGECGMAGIIFVPADDDETGDGEPRSAWIEAGMRAADAA